MDLLEERRDRNLGLKKVTVRSCRVHEFEDELRELVEEVEWDNVMVEDPASDSDSDSSSEDTWLGNRVTVRTEVLELPFNPSDFDACERYHNYLAE